MLSRSSAGLVCCLTMVLVAAMTAPRAYAKDKYFTVLLQGVQVLELPNSEGDDAEFYVVVAGRTGNGAVVSGTHPGEKNNPSPGGGIGEKDGHWWNIHKKDDKHGQALLNHFIWREKLPDGATANVNVVF